MAAAGGGRLALGGGRACGHARAWLFKAMLAQAITAKLNYFVLNASSVVTHGSPHYSETSLDLAIVSSWKLRTLHGDS